MAKPPIRFTQERVRTLKPPATGRDEIRDAGQNGLYLRITDQGIRTWRIIKRNPQTGRLERFTLGRWPDISVDQARFMAQEVILEINKGHSPAAAKKLKKAKGKTLAQVLDDYLQKPNLTDRTRKLYRGAIQKHFSDWLNRPLDQITEADIKARHQAIGKTSPGAAGYAMRVLTGLWNHHRNAARIDGQAALPEAPTAILTRQGLHYAAQIMENHLPRAYLPDWYAAIQALNNPAQTDYLTLLLLTGLRMNEARFLRWSQIDLKARTLTLPDPKNKRPHTLPLSSHLYTLLAQRKKAAKSEWVFSNPAGEPITEYCVYSAEREVSAAIKYEFRSHCLRKTFSTEAELIGIGSHVIDKLINHKPKRGDITAVYVVLSLESLREPMEAITRHFLTLFGLPDTPADTPPSEASAPTPRRTRRKPSP